MKQTLTVFTVVMCLWRVASARDGIKSENVETIFASQPAAWTEHFAMARNGESGEYLALKVKVDEP